jgi:putative peptidoglycan lipid II flippase
VNADTTNPVPDDGTGGPTRRRLAHAAGVIALGTALSRITGFVKLAVIAYALGFHRLSDTYNIANNLPNVVYELLLGGVLTATLMRAFVEYLDREDNESISAIWTVATVLLVAVTVVGIIAAPAVVHLFSARVHGPDSARQQQVATALLRLFMPQMLFYGLTAMATVLLNARRRFALPAFAPVANNVLVIVLFLLLPHITHGVPSLATVQHDRGLLALLGLGTTAGIAAMAIAVLAGVPRSGVRLRVRFDWHAPAVHRVVALAGWTFGYVASNQVAFVIVMWLANARSGGVSAYLAAYTFFQLPHGLLAVSIMTPLDPELATAASHGDLAAMRTRFRGGLRIITLVMLPAAAGYLALARPLVDTLLRHGHLSAGAAHTTGDILVMFAIGLAPFSVYLFALRGFYALGDTRTPFIVNAFENGLNIILAFVLEPVLGVRGLGLAWSIAYLVAAVVALGALGRRVGAPFDRPTSRALGRGILAAAATAGTAVAVDRLFAHTEPVFRLAAGTMAGVAVYLGCLRMLRVRELFELVGGRTRRGMSPSGAREGRSDEDAPPTLPSGPRVTRRNRPPGRDEEGAPR